MHVRSGRTVRDLEFSSDFIPTWQATRDNYLAFEANRVACARMYSGDGRAGRPVVVWLHGYMGGQYVVEERLCPVDAFLRRGMDVVLFTLPFHGRRASRGRPAWPSLIVGRTNEGLAQAVFDARAIISWLRQNGATSIVLVGTSPGGYVASVLTTLEAVDFLLLIIPGATAAELIWLPFRGRREEQLVTAHGVTFELFQQAMTIHEPLLRVPLVTGHRVLVASSRGDCITPAEGARKLAAHLDATHLFMAGSHALHFLHVGRRATFDAALARLTSLDLCTS